MVYIQFFSNTIELKSDRDHYFYSIKINLATHNFTLVNTSIIDIRYGNTSNDPIGTLDYFIIEFGDECSLSYYHVEDEVHNQGRYDLLLEYKNINSSDLTNIDFVHPGASLKVFHDRNNDSGLTINISDTNCGAYDFLDDIFVNLEFSPYGNVDWKKAHPENVSLYGMEGILNYTFQDLYETIEDGTSVLNWGFNGTLIEFLWGDWNTNATIDYQEKFHFSAKNGTAKLKSELILDNFSCPASFLEGYNISDVMISNMWHVWASVYKESGKEPVEWIFEGIQINNTNSYLVNETKIIKAGDIDLGDIDYGDKYLWNKSSSIPVTTILAHRPLTPEEYVITDNGNLLYFTQGFNKFEGERIEFDPELLLYFSESKEIDVDDGDNDEDDSEDDNYGGENLPQIDGYDIVTLCVISFLGIIILIKRKRFDMNSKS